MRNRICMLSVRCYAYDQPELVQYFAEATTPLATRMDAMTFAWWLDKLYIEHQCNWVKFYLMLSFVKATSDVHVNVLDCFDIYLVTFIYICLSPTGLSSFMPWGDGGHGFLMFKSQISNEVGKNPQCGGLLKWKVLWNNFRHQSWLSIRWQFQSPFRRKTKHMRMHTGLYNAVTL